MTNDTETINKIVKESSSFVSDNLEFINDFLKLFKNILEPVNVSYSNELLANQINDIAIILFILSILFIIIFNLLVIVYNDRLINKFKNKFIIWYLTINKKIIGIKIIFISITILYFMFQLSYGIHFFFATHPINFN